jgi:hypothetical protein
MANTPFDTYFADRPELIGNQPLTGDATLVLRDSTVFRKINLDNRAFAVFSDDSDETQCIVIDTWVKMANVLSEQGHTTTFTYANNAFTYVGDNTNIVNTFMASMTCKKLLGAIPGNYDIGVFVNDLQVSSSMSVAVYQGQFSYVSCTVQRLLVTGDVIDMRVRARTYADEPLTISDGQLVIS